MKTLIVSAMRNEIKPIIDYYHNRLQAVDYHDYFLFSLELGEDTYLIGNSGIGKANAAIFTSLICKEYGIDLVLNIGVAGGLSDVEIHDVIIPDKITYWDFNPRQLAVDYPHMESVFFEADRESIEDLTNKTELKQVGLGISGDTFLKDKNILPPPLQKANVVDMECAAYAQACYIQKVKFVAIKCISDKADSNASSDFQENIKMANEKLKNTIIDIIG